MLALLVEPIAQHALELTIMATAITIMIQAIPFLILDLLPALYQVVLLDLLLLQMFEL